MVMVMVTNEAPWIVTFIIVIMVLPYVAAITKCFAGTFLVLVFSVGKCCNFIRPFSSVAESQHVPRIHSISHVVSYVIALMIVRGKVGVDGPFNFAIPPFRYFLPPVGIVYISFVMHVSKSNDTV